MSKRRWMGLAGLVGVVFVGAFVRRCDPIPPPTDFSYGSHLRPRVFVSHEPLVPAPGSTVTIRLAPDLGAGVTVQRAVALFRESPGFGVAQQDCTAKPDGTFTCDFILGPAPGARVYGGQLELSNGERVSARAEYRFTALASLTADSLIDVRVPQGAPQGFSDDYRVDLAWVRDLENYTEQQFTADAAGAMLKGILADPVYRWRDNQLGFFLYTRAGFVESYYVPRDTRCGKNPWPRDAGWPVALTGIEVVGVLHRKTTSPEGIEGSGTAPANVVFRDCAGQAAKRTTVGTFSASAGIAAFLTVAKHEFGHAAWGLGDEYTEATSTRNVPPSTGSILGSACCCRVDDTPGGTTGGTTGGTAGGTTGGNRGGSSGVVTPIGNGVKRCIAPGGQETLQPITGVSIPALPSCGLNASLPPHCGASPDSGCPGLAGNCVRTVPWLGVSPPSNASTERPNVSPSESACNDAVQKATAHPAVEDPARSLGNCRQVCGPNTSDCPCTGGEFWIADRDPRVAGATPVSDTMGVVSAAVELKGGTCQWCVETSLCVRWHRARGDDAAKTWTACEAPPKQATQFERLWNALVAWINAILAAILNAIRF
jgi:hypothetical protein